MENGMYIMYKRLTLCVAAIGLALTMGGAWAVDYDSADDGLTIDDTAPAGRETTTWSGEDITFNADADDVDWVVNNPASITGANGMLVTGSGYDANLTFTGNSVHFTGNVLLDSTGAGTTSLTLDGITGSFEVGGRLGVGNNSSVIVTGSTLIVDDFLMEGTNAAITLDTGASFTSSGLSGINEGTLTVTAGAGTVRFDGGLVVSGQDAIMNAFGDVRLGDNTGIELLAGGQLHVRADATIVSAANDSAITNTGGLLQIADGAILTADSIVSSAGDDLAAGAIVEGTVDAASFTVAGGRTDVAAGSDVLAGVFAVSGGAANIDGAVIAADFNASAGRTEINAGGEVTAGDFTVSGTAVVNVNDNGAIADSTSLAITGGAMNVAAGAVVGDYVANGGTLASLAMSGAGVLNLDGAVAANFFTMSGGVININDGGNMIALAPSGSLSGNIVVADGLLAFGMAASFAGVNNGVASGITSANDNARVTVASGRLTIGSGALLDAGSNNITIEASSLRLEGTGAYQAGYNNGAVTMASVVGGGLDAQSNEIRLTSRLRTEAAKLDFAGGETLLVLATDAAAGNVATLQWDSGDTIYEYMYRQDAVSGLWGLYLTGAGALTDEERHQRLLDRWNKDPNVNGNASRLIRRDLAAAIREAGDIILGRDPYDQNSYANLSSSGQFNADVLYSFSDTSVDTVDYSALMLYNGSALTQVNQAVLDAAGLILKKVNSRTSFVRNELYMCGQTVSSDAALASQAVDVLDNRVWASLFTSSENASRSQGFAGYEYKPRGIMVGYDRLLCETLTVGVAFGFNGGDYKDKSALGNSSQIDNYSITLYGGYNHPSGIFLTGALGYAYSDNQIRDRRLLHAGGVDLLGENRADYHSTSYMASLAVGYDLRPADYLTISPSIGLAYAHAANSAHSQFFTSDDGSAAANTLNAGRVKNHSTTMPLEVAVTYDLVSDDDALLSITGNIGYALEFHNQGAGGSVSYGGLGMLGSVDAVSRKPGRHILTLGVGAKYTYKQFEFGFGYDYVGRKNYNSHNVAGNFGYNF